MSARQILVVDDEELIRWSLAERLRLDGHEILEAGTAAQAFDYFFWGFGQKLVVAELALIVSEFFFKFFQVFLQAFALGGDVDLSFIDYVNIEAGGAAGAGLPGERVVNECDVLDVTKALDGAAILFDHGTDGGIRGEEFDRHFYFGLDFQFRAYVSDVNN